MKKGKYPMEGYPKLPEGPRNLPVFKGYFVDARLKQFRRVEVPVLTDDEGVEEYYEGISFTSKKGRRLLAEIKKMALHDHDHNADLLLQEILVLTDQLDLGFYNYGYILDWGPPVGSLGDS